MDSEHGLPTYSIQDLGCSRCGVLFGLSALVAAGDSERERAGGREGERGRERDVHTLLTYFLNPLPPFPHDGAGVEALGVGFRV